METEVINEVVSIDENITQIAQEAAANPILNEVKPQAETAIDLTPVIDNTLEAAELIEFAYDGLTPLYPSLINIYTLEVRAKLAARTGALMNKYGWTTGGLLEKWGAEVGFIVVIIPLIGKTSEAIKADSKARELKSDKEQGAAIPNSAMQPLVDEIDQNALHLRA